MNSEKYVNAQCSATHRNRVVGLVAGLVGGPVGSAGGSIMIPGILIAGVVPDYKTAVGTILLALVAPLSVGALIPFWKSKKVNVRVAVILMIAAIVGAYLAGGLVTKHVSNHRLLFLYGDLHAPDERLLLLQVRSDRHT